MNGSLSFRVFVLIAVMVPTAMAQDRLLDASLQKQQQEADVHTFGQCNFSIRLPSKPKASRIESGFRYEVNASTAKLSVEVVRTVDTNYEELFDQTQQLIRDNPATLVFESTPIKWQGHFGREWAFFHEGTPHSFQTRCRDVFVEGMLYRLRYESVFTPTGGDAELSRHSNWDAAKEFFDSLKLIRRVRSSQKPPAPTLLGRWVVRTQDGRDMKAGDSLVFAGGTKGGGFRCGNHQEWNVPGGGVRQRGFFLCDAGAPPKTLTIILFSDPGNKRRATCKFQDETLTLTFESTQEELGLGKTLVLTRPGDVPAAEPLSQNPNSTEPVTSTASSRKSGDQSNVVATQGFPASNGIYRTSRRTTLIGLPNVLVYDYLVFDSQGQVFVIKGGYLPGRHYLEQPDVGGAFTMRMTPLAEQPDEILNNWIGKPGEVPPAHTSIQVAGDHVRFRLKEYDSSSGKMIEVDYDGKRTPEGLTLSRRANLSGAVTFTSQYAYITSASLKSTESSGLKHGATISESVSISSRTTLDLADLAKMPASEVRAHAEKGDAAAQLQLSTLLIEGVSDPTSHEQMAAALRWLRSSADQKYEPAMLGLGNVYRLGLGVDVDLQKAEQSYLAAVKDGTGAPETHLGLLRLSQQRYKDAAGWFAAAIQKGETTAHFQLGKLLTTKTIGQAEYAPAESYFAAGAKLGCDQSMLALGEMHMDGTAESADRRDGIAWYQKAASKGNLDAIYNLGVIAYGDGKLDEAARRFRAAADKGHVDATLNYGVVLFQQRDYDGSERWLQKAAKMGSREAIDRLHIVRRQKALLRNAYR